MNGDHARVERDRVARFPSDVTGALPFADAARLAGAEDLLSRFIDVEPVVGRLASVQFNHVFAHEVVGGKAEETLHSRVDVADVEVAVRDGHQL